MQVVGVELAVRCKACATPVAINGLVPSAKCDACARTVPLLAPFWGMLFRGPIAESAIAPMNHEQSSPFTTEEGVFHFVHRHTEAPCGKCGAALAIDAVAVTNAATTGSVRCSACSTGLAARPMPAGLSIPAIALIVGEDVDQVVPERARKIEPQPLACPTCGGALQVQGDARVVTCHYCSAQATLPDELWQRMHPIRPVRRWYLACDLEAQTATTLATWSKLTNAVVDDEGNVCCVGRLLADDAHASVWSFTPDGVLRWVKRDVPQTRWDRTRIIAIRGNRLAVWERGTPNIHVLQARDGETSSIIAGRVPGPPPRYGAPLTVLDLDRCDALAFDVDGTMLAAIGDVFARFSATGDHLPTWPAIDSDEPAEEHFMTTAYGPPILRLQSRPSLVSNARVLLGGDDRLYLYGTGDLAKLDRNGQLHWARSLGEVPSGDSRMGVDADGTISYTTDSGIVQCDRYGRAQSRIERRTRGGVLGNDEPFLAVGRDGTMHALGHEGRHRRLGPDGKIAHISAASRAADDA